VEAPVQDEAPARKAAPSRAAVPVSIADISVASEARISTGLGELDRVLGGGAVIGSLNLISGEPGIGKSTLLMQICRDLTRFASVLYVSGEEALRQLKLRGERLGVDRLDLLAETEIESILAAVESAKPDILIIDSIQTLYSAELSSAPGSVGQVKACASALMRLAKQGGMTVFLIGHVNKEGAIAGPKVLEHMVDCVLYFEGERHNFLRVLRAEKNRFGSTNEIGVFEMRSEGLAEVPNPSEMLLAGRPSRVAGTCVACVMEGSRPMLAEMQALLTPTAFGNPRRTVSGFDYNRAMLLLAVLEKRGGLFAGNQDCYFNIVGGLRVAEPSADLPALLAMASSLKDAPVPDGLVSFGEIGLAGEIRSVTGIPQRLAECARLGFTRAVIPAQGTKQMPCPDGIEVLRARTIRDAMEFAALLG
jgi:DNA repair protein RadA/Sms